MTSKPLSVEQETKYGTAKLSDIFDIGIFRHQLQRQWPTGLMYFLILFFAFPVAGMLLMKNPETLYAYFSTTNIFVLIYAVFAGFFSGVAVIRFLYHGDSTNFYHSLPVKRTCWLMTNTMVSLALQILAWLGTLAVLSLVLLTAGTSLPNGSASVWEGFLDLSGLMLVYYLFFFGVSLFSGMLCGSGPMHFFMTVFLLGIVPALYLSVAGMLLVFAGTLNADYYLSIDIFRRLSTFFTMCTDVGYSPPVSSYLRAAIIGLILIAAAFLCYRIRRSECSGQPVVFNGVRTWVKYLIMIPAALGIGIFFYALGSDAWVENSVSAYLWLLFGLVCGVFLSFMLLNTVLNRNAKMMFTGIRACAVFTAAVLLFSNAVYFDVFGLATFVPSASAVGEIELRLGRSYADGVMIDDSSVVALICDRLRALEKTKSDKEEGAYHYYRGDSIVYHTNIGFPIAKMYDMQQMPEEWYREIIQEVVSLDDFAERYLAPFYDDLLTMPDSGQYMSVTWAWSESRGFRATKEEFIQILDACRTDFREKGGQAMQGTLIGILRCDGNIIPVFQDSENLLRVLTEHINKEQKGWTWTSRMKSMLQAVRQITVYESSSGEKWVIKDVAEIQEIIPHLSSLSTTVYFEEQQTTPYTLRDSRYQVEIEWGFFDWLYQDNEIDMQEDSGTVTITSFLWNSVPEWLENP